MLDLIASCLVRALNLFFHIMPMRFNLWLGRRLGVLAYYLSGRRRAVTYANLKAAFCAEKTPREIKRISRNVYRHAAQTFVEIISMTKFDKKYIDRFVDVRNMERVEKASKNPGGMVLVSAHFGNWELSTATSAAKGFPLNMLTRDQKMERLNELLNRLREMKGSTLIRKGAAAKNIFRVLRKGEGVGLLADQNAGPNGKLIDFFGRAASTAVGPYRLAQKTGAWVLPAFIHRTEGPYHELILEEPMVIEKDEDIVPYMREYNRLLEKHIRKHPDQWFWMHKRWKMTPVKKIMVLDDGKKGHLKQSLAVVRQIERFREDEGYAPGQVEVDIVPVRFKNKAARVIFNSVSPLFTSGCQGCLGCLKAAVNAESYETLAGRYADVVISCGSALVGVNRMMKIENNARNLTVLDPGYFDRGKFDLVVMPRHDLARGDLAKENMIITDMAPNLIRKDEIASLKSRMTDETKGKIAGRICVGLLFGGDNPCFIFGEELTRKIADDIKALCARVNGCFYATTSRRTSPVAEEILKKTLKGDAACVDLVSGKEDKDEHTVEKILALSDIIIVSGESISMVSEAVSSGKPVLVFFPDKTASRCTKYEQFVEDLETKGYLKCVGPERIPEEAARIIERKEIFTPPEDNKKIYEKLYRLF